MALLEQRDCGKPVKQAIADAAALARYFEFYAGVCDKLHCETTPYSNGYSVMPWREPHGVTGHIISWNYPVQMFGRSVGGALAASIVCVVAAGIRKRDGVQQFRIALAVKNRQVSTSNYGAGGGVELPFGRRQVVRPRPREGA